MSIKPKHQRLAYALFSLVLLSGATLLVLRALRTEIMYFYSPSEIAGLSANLRRRPMRLGGLVEHGSVRQLGTEHTFRVTDGKAGIGVRYHGSLPALFREDQGIVTEGALDGDVFVAERVLAKHDEKYMPPDVARKLKATGRWKENTGKGTQP